MGTKVAQDPIAISGPPFRNDGAKMGRSDFARSPGRWLKRQNAPLDFKSSTQTRPRLIPMDVALKDGPSHGTHCLRTDVQRLQAEMQVLQKKHFSSQAWQPLASLLPALHIPGLVVVHGAVMAEATALALVTAASQRSGPAYA